MTVIGDFDVTVLGMWIEIPRPFSERWTAILTKWALYKTALSVAQMPAWHVK